MTRKTARLSSACAAIIASALVAGCDPPRPIVSNEPACARWKDIKPDPWQELQIYGPDYPAKIGPDFPKWRTLVEQMAGNNTNRREYCGH